ncbi:MAG: SOS response-associated peptidase family protein, partial [Actinomycetota bacterium]
NLVPGHRCVVPMTGYYEWLTTKEAKRKIPYFISRRDGLPLGVAALWDSADADSGGYPRACIITVAANPRLAEIHDRMPAVLVATRWPHGSRVTPQRPYRSWHRWATAFSSRSKCRPR